MGNHDHRSRVLLLPELEQPRSSGIGLGHLQDGTGVDFLHRHDSARPAKWFSGTGRNLREDQSPAAGVMSGASTVRIGPLNQFLADTNHEITAYSATAPTITGQ